MDQLLSSFKFLEQFNDISSRNIKGKMKCLKEVTNVQISVRNNVRVGSVFSSYHFSTVFVIQYLDTDVGLCQYYI